MESESEFVRRSLREFALSYEKTASNLRADADDLKQTLEVYDHLHAGLPETQRLKRKVNEAIDLCMKYASAMDALAASVQSASESFETEQ